jgi:hypothetical protein
MNRRAKLKLLFSSGCSEISRKPARLWLWGLPKAARHHSAKLGFKFGKERSSAARFPSA